MEERPVSDLVLVTGGAGYIGVPLCEELVASGRRVRALDVLLHGQTAMVDRLTAAGVEVTVGAGAITSPSHDLTHRANLAHDRCDVG